MILKIKQIREGKGLSINELSKLSGISASYISELENEQNNKKNPTISVICKLAKALEVKPQELFEC